MREAGCKTIWFGVESGCPRVLERINKKTLETRGSLQTRPQRRHPDSMQLHSRHPRRDIGETWRRRSSLHRNSTLTCASLTFSSLTPTANCTRRLQSGNYEKLDDFLLSAKTEEFDFNKLMEIQRRFHKEFNTSAKRVMWRIRKEGPLKVAKSGFHLLTSKQKK